MSIAATLNFDKNVSVSIKCLDFFYTDCVRHLKIMSLMVKRYAKDHSRSVDLAQWV